MKSYLLFVNAEVTEKNHTMVCYINFTLWTEVLELQNAISVLNDGPVHQTTSEKHIPSNPHIFFSLSNTQNSMIKHEI